MEKMIQAGGHDLHYYEAGPESRPAIVMVHGIGVSARYFLPLIRQLEGRFHVMVLDLSGFGTSPKPQHALDIEGHAKVVREFINKLGLEVRYLAGHSMGCQIVAAYLQAYPSGAVQKAVLIGPTVYGRERNAFMHFLRLAQNGFGEPLSLLQLHAKDYIACGPRIYFKTLRHMLNDRIEERLPDIKTEIILARGRHDRIVPAEWIRRLEVSAPKSKVVEIAGGRHGVHYSRPEELAELF